MAVGVIRRSILTFAILALAAFAQESYEARGARLQPQDIPPLLEKARDGDLPSQILLWLAYSGGHGVPKDLQKGLPWLRKAAEHEVVECQFILSDILENGYGKVPVDHGESFRWALAAAQHGHVVAQHNVAGDYMNGVGTHQNLDQARYWYTKAAEQGFAHSQWMLGRIFATGIGVPVNREEALKWFSKSLAQGHAGTMMSLAQMYSDPNGVPQQPQLVYDLYRASAQLGNHYSEFELGRFYHAGYLGAPDYAQARSWFEKASTGGYAPAEQYLGEMSESGNGGPIESAQAISHYEKAADAGVSAAIQRLGEIYRDGAGIRADPVIAATWFAIGAKMGVSESSSALQTLNSKLSDAQRQMAAARANTWIVEHPDAMKQTPEHFNYQGWELVSREPLTKRGPSTGEERTYAIRLTQTIETDPLSLDASAARAWLDKWWVEIPDIFVRPCNLVDPPNHEPLPHGDILYKQITYSQGVFFLQNPSKTADWDSAFLAGMEGSLKVYESILKSTSSARSPFLDDLAEQRRSGRLPETVRILVRERCK